MGTVSRLHAQANISILYQELPFLERASAAAKDGFLGIEIGGRSTRRFQRMPR